MPPSAPPLEVQRNELLNRNQANVLPLGCAFFFILPLAFFGVVLIMIASGSIAAESDAPSGLLFAVATVMLMIATGILLAVIFSWRHNRQLAAIVTRHPEEPWRWRTDWVAGFTRDATRGTAWALWIFATIWCLISFPIAWIAVGQRAEEGNVVLVTLIFPIVGVLLLANAVFHTWKAFRYGRSILQLQTHPAQLGGTFRGVLEGNLPSGEDYLVRAACVHEEVRGSGKSRTTYRNIVWQNDTEIRGQMVGGASGMSLPIAIPLARDARETARLSSTDRILWLLDVSAEVTGADYDAQFEFPVYGTSSVDSPITRSDVTLRPKDVRVDITAEGTSYTVRPTRRFAAFVSGIAWISLFAGLTSVLAHFSVPIGFTIFSAFVLLLTIWGTVDNVLGSTTVTVRGEECKLSKSNGFLSSERSFTRQEIEKFSLAEPTSMNAPTQFMVDAVLKNGKIQRLCRPLKRRRDAVFLKAELERWHGRDRRPEMDAGSEP